MSIDTVIHILTAILVLVTCMPVHECAHAFMANKLGDPTSKERITLNPLKHLDLIGSLFLLVSAVLGFGFGWAKPVQINARNFKNPKLGMGLSALAGPVSNILLAWIATVIYKCLSYGSLAAQNQVLYLVAQVFFYVIILNIGLAVFNLLPVPPLDGSRIMLLVLPEKIYFKIMRYERIIMLVLMMLLWSGWLNPVLSAMRNGMLTVMDFTTGFIDFIMRSVL